MRKGSKKTKNKNEKENNSRVCKISECSNTAQYPAPRRIQVPLLHTIDEAPLDRDWYCEDHIKEFNSNYNFFEGMTDEEIMRFQKDAVHGHLKTSPSNKKVASLVKKIELAARKIRFGEDSKQNITSDSSVPKELVQHLKLLELNYPFTSEDLRKAYRIQAKKYHPDRSGQNADKEKFTKVTESYKFLRKSI